LGGLSLPDLGGDIRILIIEDDERLARLVKTDFERQHYRVDTAHDGDIGLEMALSGAYAVAIIDWMLPGRDGLAICRAVRNARMQLAILMLTARARVADRILGLDSGADDYLNKPFDLDELSARVRAVSRRFVPIDAAASDPMELRCGDITLDLRGHTARRGMTGLSLTQTEWHVLECLMRHPNQALSREQIFSQVWVHDGHACERLNVDQYISYVRRKLRMSPDLSDPIETVRGVGYRLNTSKP